MPERQSGKTYYRFVILQTLMLTKKKLRERKLMNWETKQILIKGAETNDLKFLLSGWIPKPKPSCVRSGYKIRLDLQQSKDLPI